MEENLKIGGILMVIGGILMVIGGTLVVIGGVLSIGRILKGKQLIGGIFMVIGGRLNSLLNCLRLCKAGIAF